MANGNGNGHRDDARDDEPIDAISGEVLAPLESEVSPAIAAEINQQVATARRYPRRPLSVISDEIRQMACLTESMAAECMYSLKRGDKPITGPSIRFAEIVRSAYGNMRVAARFVRIDADDPTRAAVLVEAAALDVQNNNLEAIPVRRSIMTSAKGPNRPRMFSADMINTTVMAAVAIARRNAILAVVPKPVWHKAYERAIEVIKGSADTFQGRLKTILDEFAKHGAAPAQVFEALGIKDHRDVTTEHMPALMGFLNSIKEGETVASVFGRQVIAEREATGVADPLNDAPQKDEAKPADDKPEQAQATKAQTAAATAETEAHERRQEPQTQQRDEPQRQEQTTTTGNTALGNDEYIDASAGGIRFFKSKAQLEDWWKGQRDERRKRNLTATQLAKLQAMLDARRQELAEAAQ